MTKILKYSLQTNTLQKVKTLAGEVLTVQDQNGVPMMWVLVEDDEKKMVERVVRITMTGSSFISDNLQYLTTLFLDGGTLVFHVFVGDAVTEEGGVYADDRKC